MKRIIGLLCAFLLAGCQTIHTFVEEHPKAVGVTAALIVGGLAASSGGGAKTREIGIPSNPCTTPEACR